MTLHLVKLCVGCDSVEDLRDHVSGIMRQRRAAGEPEFYRHVTRMTPKRVEDLLPGGSLYWVIRGTIQCRQELAAIEQFVDGEGISRCRLLLRPEIVATAPQPKRPFQGWRYLPAADAPRDLAGATGDDLPLELQQELAALGLL